MVTVEQEDGSLNHKIGNNDTGATTYITWDNTAEEEDGEEARWRSATLGLTTEVVSLPEADETDD